MAIDVGTRCVFLEITPTLILGLLVGISIGMHKYIPST
jgi:hypothetical protein